MFFYITLGKGKDDIRYNFLIGQDGVIYEGRGWGVVGQHTSGEDDTSIGMTVFIINNSRIIPRLCKHSFHLKQPMLLCLVILNPTIKLFVIYKFIYSFSYLFIS